MCACPNINLLSIMDSQIRAARELECEISDLSSMFSSVTEEKEEEEEDRTAPPSPCHGIHKGEFQDVRS